MSRTPDEIKKGLECCGKGITWNETCGTGCPYMGMYVTGCSEEISADALTLIQQLQAENAELSGKIGQLQAERDAAVNDLKTVCNMMNICSMCKDADEGSERCEECGMSSNWEWRGATKEG